MITKLCYHNIYNKLKHINKDLLTIWKKKIHVSRTSGYHQYHKKKVNLVNPVFIQASNHIDRVAVIDQYGQHTYGKMLNTAEKLTDNILTLLNKDLDVDAERICFLCGNDVSYVITQWAAWMSGGIAVPLCTSHPVQELQYFLENSQSKLLIYTEEFQEKVKPLLDNGGFASLMLTKDKFLLDQTEESDADFEAKKCARRNRLQQLALSNKFKNREAMIIYTSGTTGRPKGVVHTFGSLDAQMQGMITAWKWSAMDVVLHVLPLHHVHGIVNVLMTPLYVGAMCVMLPKFNASQVWSTLLSPAKSGLPRGITVFMAVPTIYAKLIDHLNETQHCESNLTKKFIKTACSTKIRLMVSGSAALPEPVMNAWEEMTGHKLLERYGMTEIGMALTNPLNGPRIPGSVGIPFPNVEVSIGRPNVYAENGYDVLVSGNSRRSVVTKGQEEEQGELLIKGPNVFKEYWNKLTETTETFTKDGWFKTGDTACYENGTYRIRGRTSVDIIKSGGFKISALDIEQHLLGHPHISDIAVLGIPDVTWGQKIAVVAVLYPGNTLTLDQLKDFCRDKMASYQIPTELRLLETMPRNAMGKINKKELLADIFNVS